MGYFQSSSSPNRVFRRYKCFDGTLYDDKLQ